MHSGACGAPRKIPAPHRPAGRGGAEYRAPRFSVGTANSGGASRVVPRPVPRAGPNLRAPAPRAVRCGARNLRPASPRSEHYGGRSHHRHHHHPRRILPPSTPPTPPPTAAAEIATITINPVDVAIAAVSTQKYYSWGGGRTVTEGGERRCYRRGQRQA